MPSSSLSKSSLSSRAPLHLILLLLLLTSGFVPAAAEARQRPRETRPWDGPAFSASPRELLAAARDLPAPENAAVEVLLAETSYTLESHGLTSYRQRLVYRILDPAGLQAWASVDSPWSPWYQDRPQIRARVVSPDGAAHRLDPATLTEQGSGVGDPDLFEDERVLRAPLPAAEVGSVVETVVSVEHPVPYFAAGETRRQWLAMTVPVRRAVVTVDAAAEAPLALEHRGLAAEPGRMRRGERVIHLLEARELEPLTHIPAGLPPEVPLGPYVAFSTGSTWAQVARAYSEIVDAKIEATAIRNGESLEAFLKELSPEDPPGAGAAHGAGSSQWQRVEELMRELHRRVRYTGVELGEGGLIPRSPHETLARRYGDCKDKAVLLTALLRREGIPAYLALLYAGTVTDVPPELPGLGLFNHVLVYVPGSSPLWIDPTDPYSRLGEIPSLAQGRRALVASPNTGGLVVTPVAGPEDNHARELREYHLAELGPGRVVETGVYRGTEAREIRSSWAGAPVEDIEEILEGYVGEVYGARELGRLDFTPPEDITRPLEMELEARRAGWVVSDLDEAVVVLDYSPLFSGLPAALLESGEEPRETDFILLEPYGIDWRIRVHVPEALELRELPEGSSRHLGPALFETSFELAADGRTLVGTVSFATGPRRWTPEQVEAFREAVEAFDAEGQASRVLFFDQKVARHLGDGDLVAAVAEAKRLMGMPPERAFPHAQMVRALLAAGLGEEARRSARKATEAEPRAAVGWTILARTLTHDPLGRHFHPGFDRQGAEGAYRRSLEIDPEQPVVRADLAILLEHDGEGVRYGPGAELGDAIEQYRRALEGGQLAFQVRVNLWIALLRAGRFDQLRRELGDGDLSPELAYLRLAATAMSRDPEAAAREARRLVGDAGQQSAALAAAGQQLLLLGRYDRAAALLAAAARSADNPAALLSQAEMLRGIESHTEPRVRTGSPEATARSFMELLLLAEGAELEDGLLRLMVPPLRDVLRRELQEEGNRLTDIQHLWASLEREGMPPQVLHDLTLSALETRVEGDDASGYTVEVRAGFGTSSRTTDLWLAREGGEVLLVGGDRDPESAGLYAWNLLERGDTEGARRWIRRAVQESSPALPGTAAEDPVAGPVLPGLLERLGGEGAGDGENTGAVDETASLRWAAAALVLLDESEALGEEQEQAREMLEAAQRRLEPEARLQLDRIRLLGALLRDEPERVETLARRLLEAHPESELAAQTLGGALLETGEHEAVEALADRLQAREPGQVTAKVLRAEVAVARGDVDRALEIMASLLEEPSARATWFNNAAWYALALGRVDRETLRWAQQAAERTGYRSSADLHTLAALYAELGRAAEAHRVLLQSLEASGEEPAGAEWLVLGRLAEHFGLPEAARRYYRRVEPPEDAPLEAVSAHRLAARRLEAMEVGAGGGNVGGGAR